MFHKVKSVSPLPNYLRLPRLADLLGLLGLLRLLRSIIALNGVILQTGDYGAITIHRQNNSTAPARNS